MSYNVLALCKHGLYSRDFYFKTNELMNLANSIWLKAHVSTSVSEKF